LFPGGPGLCLCFSPPLLPYWPADPFLSVDSLFFFALCASGFSLLHCGSSRPPFDPKVHVPRHVFTCPTLRPAVFFFPLEDIVQQLFCSRSDAPTASSPLLLRAAGVCFSHRRRRSLCGRRGSFWLELSQAPPAPPPMPFRSAGQFEKSCQIGPSRGPDKFPPSFCVLCLGPCCFLAGSSLRRRFPHFFRSQSRESLPRGLCFSPIVSFSPLPSGVLVSVAAECCLLGSPFSIFRNRAGKIIARTGPPDFWVIYLFFNLGFLGRTTLGDLSSLSWHSEPL